MKAVSYTVTRNGKSGHLEKTISSLEKVVDYILVCVSKDSEDGTLEFCRNHPAVNKVITEDMEWPDEEHRIRMKARNAVIEENPDTDWLIALDDDEVFADPDLANRFFKNEQSKKLDSAGAKFYELWKDFKYRDDFVWGPEGEKRRIFEHVGRLGDEIPGSGAHCGRIPGNPRTAPKPGPNEKVGGFIPVIHLGWWNKSLEELKAKQKKMVKNNESTGSTHTKKIQSITREPELSSLPSSMRSELKSLIKAGN